MILFVILGKFSPLLEIKIIKIATSGPKHFLGQQSWFSHCDVTTKKTPCELYKGFFLKKINCKSRHILREKSRKSPYLDNEFLLVARTRQESFLKLTLLV